MKDIDRSLGKNLKRIRLLKNLSLSDAGKLLNMSATAVSKYEKGEILLNSKKIIEFSNFRKNRKLNGQNLKLLEEIIQNKISNYLEVIDLCNINLNKKYSKYQCDNIEQAEEMAIQFRKFLGISNKQPISDLINILENLGIIITQIDDDKKFDGFDGVSYIVDNTPVIVISKNIKDEEGKDLQ